MAGRHADRESSDLELRVHGPAYYDAEETLLLAVAELLAHRSCPWGTSNCLFYSRRLLTVPLPFLAHFSACTDCEYSNTSIGSPIPLSHISPSRKTWCFTRCEHSLSAAVCPKSAISHLIKHHTAATSGTHRHFCHPGYCLLFSSPLSIDSQTPSTTKTFSPQYDIACIRTLHRRLCSHRGPQRASVESITLSTSIDYVI